MKPTLYAEDIKEFIDPLSPSQWSTLQRAVARVLPRRCPCQQFGEPEDFASRLMDEQGCPKCGGAGFLYPDPPDWWRGVCHNPDDWHIFLLDVWRVLGVVEVTDA